MKKLQLLLLVAFFTIICSAPAFAGTAGQIIFGVDQHGGFHLEAYDLDNPTASPKFIGNIPTEVENLTGVGGGIFYGIQSNGGTNCLYEFKVGGSYSDGYTMSEKLISDAIGHSNIDSMDWDGTNLYAISNNSVTGNATTLFKLGLDGSVVGTDINLDSSGGFNTLRNDKFEGMAYNVADGYFYLSYTHKFVTVDGVIQKDVNNKPIWSEKSDLFKMDSSGNLTLLGIMGYAQVEALTFIDGALYGVSDGTDNLFEINFDVDGNFTGTGDGSTWKHDIEGMAVGSTVPIPGAIWLLGSGLMGLVGFKRRKKS